MSVVSERRRHGRFYTPAAVADLTIAVALGDRWPPARTLDPSCGDGAMLAAAHRRGVASEALVGRDNDPEAVEQARAALPGAVIELVDLFDATRTERFSAIVGNPPYVRNDRISEAAKEAMTGCLAALYPGLETAGMVSRGDLAACALLRSVALLEPGGRLGFIVSAALLEADYAEPMWRALDELGCVRDIVAAPAERWFAAAAVNTILVVFERGERGDSTRVSRLRRPTRECAQLVREGDGLERVADVHRDASASPRRWAHLLRASPAWLACESSDALIPLGELADIRRGVTSGANEIFYLSRAKARAEGLEPSALAPLVRAQKGACPIPIDADSVDSVVLRAPRDCSALPGVSRYLARHAAAATRPTLASRDPWWKLPSRPARLFLAKAYARRFVQRLAPTPLDCDQRVYAVWPRAGVDIELLAAILNGSLTALAIESLGRASMGEGALEWTVADARSLPVLDPRRVAAAGAGEIGALFGALCRRPIETCELEAERPDRRALDRALLALDPHLAGFADDVAEHLATAAAARDARASAVLSD